LAGLERNRDNDSINNNDISNKDSINDNDISDNDTINDNDNVIDISDNKRINDKYSINDCDINKNDINNNEIDINCVCKRKTECGYSKNISWAGGKEDLRFPLNY